MRRGSEVPGMAFRCTQRRRHGGTIRDAEVMDALGAMTPEGRGRGASFAQAKNGQVYDLGEGDVLASFKKLLNVECVKNIQTITRNRAH